MAHQLPSGGLPSGHPNGDVNANKRPVPDSSEKGNQQPSSRVIQPSALMFPDAPPPAPVILVPPAAPPPVGAPQNKAPPVNGSQPWTSDSARAQASINAAAAEAKAAAAAEADFSNVECSDGTTGETESLTAALSNFSIHTDKVANRAASISATEKKRINGVMARADNQNSVPHSILITVKASVALATGQAPSGKMAKTNRADPMSKDFASHIESLVLTAAGSGAGATFKFSRVKKGRGNKGGEFVSTSFRLAFGEKVFCDRILKSKLAAHGAEIKKDFTITMRYEAAVPEAPFEGQVYHCPIIVDFKDKKDHSIPSKEYVSAAFHGGMNSKAFLGIRRGETIKKDGSGRKIHDFFEMYFDPALTANHGSQEISDKVIDMQELFGESFPIPLHPITEPPCYLASKDSTGFIHKRELMKSGDDWCQHCWGKHSGHCIYFHFCKRCLAFNPQGKKYEDFKLNRHLCNYGVHQMPNQKAPKFFVEPEQVFDAERQAHFDAQKKQAEAMSEVATQNLTLKIAAIKEEEEGS